MKKFDDTEKSFKKKAKHVPNPEGGMRIVKTHLNVNDIIEDDIPDESWTDVDIDDEAWDKYVKK